MSNKINNKGFSLVELIVVVLIMSIIVTGAVLSLSVVYNADAERAARNLCAVFESARNKAMALNSDGSISGSEVDITVRIEQDDNEDYYIRVYDKASGGNVLEEKKLANYKVSIYAGTKNTDKDTLKCGESGTEDCLEVKNGGSHLDYSFKKSTGGINVAGVSGTNYLDMIIVGNKRFKIIVSSVSGKCYIAD